tara:strand:+ start:5995 stop:7065 length:1071 start_codon:yes stop_codon:yes gene_type:complete
MTKNDLISFLDKKPSYLKKGPEYLSITFNISIDEAKLALKQAKKTRKQNRLFKPVAKLPQNTELYISELKKAIKQSQNIISTRIQIGSRTQQRREQNKLSINVPSIKDQAGMHILLGCNHVPFHHVQLHKGIINLIKDNAHLIKGFHLLGDFLDLNPLSSHDKGKFTAIPGLTLDDEYDIGQGLLYDFDSNLPRDTWKTYLYGNHEDRYNRWMSNMDNAKTPLISPEAGLGLIGRGYQVKTSWSQDYFTLGNDFDIFHGIYFSIHNGKAHLDKLRRSCAYVHTHRIQNYREGQMAAFNIGSCADFTSSAFNYASRPMKQQWANGFAINMIDEYGVSHITQINVNPQGKFYFGGKLY